MIFLSDLHFGDGGPADDFGPKAGPADRALLGYLSQWLHERKRIGLLGDIFELWQASLSDIELAHGEVIWELFRLADFYAVGNHDEELVGRNLFGLDCQPYICERELGLWAEHGHFHDPMVRNWGRPCRVISSLGGIAEKLLHPNVDLWAKRAVGWLGNTGRHGANMAYYKAVAEQAARHDCRYAVFGHTHETGGFPPVVRIGDVDIIVKNCGTWTNGKRGFAEI